MNAVDEPDAELNWLGDLSGPEVMTGFDASGWADTTWVLHAMYENRSLPSNVSHDERRQWAIGQGLIEPLIIGDVNLDERTTITGSSLGYVVRPGSEWRRLRWQTYADSIGHTLGLGEQFPPSLRWFPTASWPVMIDPPPEGSLDEESLGAIVRVLAEYSNGGPDTPCLVFYGCLASGDFDRHTVLTGPLGAVPGLVQGESSFGSTPSNIWLVDRSWFVWTDWDLSGTKVSGSPDLVSAIRAEPDLETFDWDGKV